MLLLHPVHGRSTIMHLTYLVRDACVIQYAFSCCGFTRIDVRHDTDVSIALDWRRASHDPCLLPGLLPGQYVYRLPAEMCERFVRFSHTVRVFTFLNSVTTIFCRIHKLTR